MPRGETWKVIYLSYQGSAWQPPFPDGWNSSCNNLPHKTHLSRLHWTLSQDRRDGENASLSTAGSTRVCRALGVFVLRKCWTNHVSSNEREEVESLMVRTSGSVSGHVAGSKKALQGFPAKLMRVLAELRRHWQESSL